MRSSSLKPFIILSLSLGVLFALSVVLGPQHRQPASGDDPSLIALEEDQRSSIKGLWERRRGPNIRFYYFHDGGVGLYRYGKIGHTYTNSFTYSVKGETLTLVFNKTGSTHKIKFLIEGETLTLKQDPKEREKKIAYKRRKDDFEHQALAPIKNPQGQMWIHQTPYLSGEKVFEIYQFAEGAIDGRGAGWHHRGDFSDWSTESFSYRFADDKVHLHFEVSGEKHTSRFKFSGDKNPTFSLERDPRNYWHHSTFKHMGRSFAFEQKLTK